MVDDTGPRRPGPIGGDMAAVLAGLARRLRVPALLQRHSQTGVLGCFAMINGLISIAIMAAVALVTSAPFVFPSLGPTAFLVFYTPSQPAASPRNTICGHAVGVVAGYGSLMLLGLGDAPPALSHGIDAARVAAVALSLGLTAGAMVWLRVPHPPAGATTMIISLGILTRPAHLAVLMLAVALLAVQAVGINRLAGLPYPLWAPPRPSGSGG